ncbi:MAG: ABC transporter ATP-binding protein [Burkholderiales bacterium]|nr:ABC transporter ATP-binding protein [Burkholderiales bacterium]
MIAVARNAEAGGGPALGDAAAAPPLPRIAAERLGRVFETRSGDTVTALDALDFRIAADEFVTLLGPSGCGKSTVLKLIAGVIRPSSGRILFNGTPLAKPSRDIGMVFQRPILVPWRSVLDNILFPIEMLGWPVRKHIDEAKRLIELVGLRGFERARPDELSGGMQQRVSICRALAYDPQVLLMDEPFAALDAMTREELGIELLKIWTQRRKTVVFVTHSIVEAVLLADRVIVLTSRPGRIVKEIEIGLPRPRTLDMEFSGEFKEHVEEIRALFESDRRARA